MLSKNFKEVRVPSQGYQVRESSVTNHVQDRRQSVKTSVLKQMYINQLLTTSQSFHAKK